MATTPKELWGTETKKAVENFPVSGEPIPVSVAHWLGRIKAAAARVNAELGLLDKEKAERIAAAGDRIANDRATHDADARSAGFFRHQALTPSTRFLGIIRACRCRRR